jgi:hypothetical protein
MFVELLDLENNGNTESLNEIRSRFGFKELSDDIGDDQDFFDDVYEEPAVIIKQENEENEFPFKGIFWSWDL